MTSPSMPILRNLSWGAEESPMASSRAVRICSPGICYSCRERRFCEVERSRGNVGKCVFCRRITRSRGAELPRKLSGMTSAPNPVVPCDPSRRYSNAGNDSSNNEAHFSNENVSYRYPFRIFEQGSSVYRRYYLHLCPTVDTGTT